MTTPDELATGGVVPADTLARIGEVGDGCVFPTVTLNPASWPGMTIRLDDEQLRAERTRAVEQFTAALLTGLDDLERDQHRRIAPGDVEQLVARVALELGR